MVGRPCLAVRPIWGDAAVIGLAQLPILGIIPRVGIIEHLVSAAGSWQYDMDSLENTKAFFHYFDGFLV